MLADTWLPRKGRAKECPFATEDRDGSSFMAEAFGGAFGRRETDDDSFMLRFAHDLESDYIEEALPPGLPGSLHADAAAAY